MRKSLIKLSQLVSAEQMKQKKVAEMHKVSNSLKRNIAYNQVETQKTNQYYECRLPEMGFCRKDLSLILRYIMFKEHLQIADRNLLRRILLSNFPEETIAAGTKKFIHCLKMQEGNGRLDPQGKHRLYFLLKGKGRVTSAQTQYQVNPGSIFGQYQMLAGVGVTEVWFQGNYLILALEEIDFNMFYRSYFEKKCSATLSKLRCIQQTYLNKIPQIARYLFLASVYEKTFSPGQEITKAGRSITEIYFVNLGQKMSQSLSCDNCFGLAEIVRFQRTYSQTVKCQSKKVCLPCVRVQDFQKYVLAYNQSNISLLPQNSSGLDFNLSCLSFYNSKSEPKPNLVSFMRVKKVKLPNSQLRSRISTEPTISMETTFKFLKPERLNYSFKTRVRESRYERYKSSLQQRTCKSLLSRQIQ